MLQKTLTISGIRLVSSELINSLCKFKNFPFNLTEINFAPSSSSRYSSISRLEDRSYLRSRNSKDFQPVSVKSKKQLFEEYKNGPGKIVMSNSDLILKIRS